MSIDYLLQQSLLAQIICCTIFKVHMHVSIAMLRDVAGTALPEKAEEIPFEVAQSVSNQLPMFHSFALQDCIDANIVRQPIPRAIDLNSMS